MGGLVLARDIGRVRAEEARELVRAAWEEHLREHFADEEAMLLPLIGDRRARERLLREHAELRELIAVVIGATRVPRSTLDRLARLLHEHIRWEERLLFERVQTADEEGLDGLALRAEMMQARRPSARARGVNQGAGDAGAA
jgi:hypothetical protein